ncbi:MAG: hypothetical protein PQJ60_07645, partial [Spirochaetales bacterium]|nr:hypothetical protein [Spirochaetales bacterium]
EQLEQLDEQINSHCIAWAQEYTKNLKEDEYPSEIKELLNEIESLDEAQQSIKGLLEEREQIVEQQNTVKSSESEELKSRSDIYQVLGRRAFDLYKKGALNESEGLDEIFRTLLDWEGKIRHADNELYRIRSQEDSSNVFRKLGTFLKKSSQSTIKKSAGDNLNRHYGKTGERLIREGFFTEIAQNGLSDVYDEFQDKEELSRKLKEEQASLETSGRALEEKLDELCKGSRPHRALKHMEEQREEREKDLDGAFLRMGQALYGENSENGSFRNVINDLYKSREMKNSEKARCLTDIRIAELEEKLEKKLKERDQQEEKVNREKEKWEELKKESAELEQKKGQLQKERDELSHEE